MPDLAFAREPGPKILKAHAIENILSRRQAFQQQFCGKVAIRQRVHRYRANDGLEALDR
jgi:hypothetical protein